MSGSETATPASEAAPEAQPNPTPEPPATPAAPEAPTSEPEGDTGNTADDSPESKIIAALRRENAQNRVSAREAREEAAAARAEAAALADRVAQDRQSLGQTLAEAFGFAPKPDEPVDPEQLVAAATAAREQAETSAAENARLARESQVELAVLRAAIDTDADAKGLLDSRSFMNSVRDLDPTAADFASQVGAAIAQALEDPRYRKPSPLPSRSGGDLSAGNGEPAAPKATGVAALIEERRKKRGFFR